MDVGKQCKRKAMAAADLLESKLNDDMLAEVVLRAVSVSSRPFSDLLQLRLISTRFRSATESNWVFRHIPTLDIDSRWNFPKGYDAFLERCMAVGNPHASYVTGMVEYFSLRKIDSGMQHLTKAAEGGVAEASYALGMIAYSNEQTRPQAITFLGSLTEKSAKRRRRKQDMPTLREKTKELMLSLWRNLVLVPIVGPNCSHPVCVSNRPNNWCRYMEEQQHFCSEECKWRYEYNRFCVCLGN